MGTMKRTTYRRITGRHADVIEKRCPECGSVRYDRPGVRSTCPYTALHR
jgi:hypothetical protein